MNKRQIATELAFRMWGLPYIWGGDDPIDGYDCSGMVIEILKSVGILPRKGDWTAHGLHALFLHREVTEASPGCLIFYSKDVDSLITHVEFLVTPELSIGASSGGRRTLTWKDAVRENAYIKIRPWIARNGIKTLVDPFLDESC